MRGCTLWFVCTECGLQDRPCILRGVAPLRTLVNYCHIISVGACGIAVKLLCERLQATCSAQHLQHTLFKSLLPLEENLLEVIPLLYFPRRICRIVLRY